MDSIKNIIAAALAIGGALALVIILDKVGINFASVTALLK